MGTLGVGVVLALAYALWLSAAGTGTVAGDGSEATRPQQDPLVLTQNEPAAATVTDSTQGETAKPAAPGPVSEAASSESRQEVPASVSEFLFIAGTAPSQRPEAAPLPAPEPKDSSWYNKALTGIAPPYPASLSFLEEQGAWYTPFNHPGMTGPYDIRDWHRR